MLWLISLSFFLLLFSQETWILLFFSFLPIQQTQIFSFAEVEMVVIWKKKNSSSNGCTMTAYVTVAKLIPRGFNWDTACSEFATTKVSCINIYPDLKGARFARTPVDVSGSTREASGHYTLFSSGPSMYFQAGANVATVLLILGEWLESSLWHITYHLINASHLPPHQAQTHWYLTSKPFMRKHK